jgi:hypothetical protein
MDRQHVGAGEQLVQRARPSDAQRSVGAVRQMRVEEADLEAEGLARSATAVPMRPSPTIPKPCTSERRTSGLSR